MEMDAWRRMSGYARRMRVLFTRPTAADMIRIIRSSGGSRFCGMLRARLLNGRWTRGRWRSSIVLWLIRASELMIGHCAFIARRMRPFGRALSVWVWDRPETMGMASGGDYVMPSKGISTAWRRRSALIAGKAVIQLLKITGRNQ